MPRFKLTLEYDGTSFFGWQRQADRISVQQALEEAIARFSGEAVGTQAAGRTDSGVHALGQVAHFDLSKDWDPFRTPWLC
jgi:tRNA pseudouridine38-40 synthase